MISDYSILGIEEKNDISKIKAAFRKRVKELHPDITKDEESIKNHILYIQVCNAYNRLSPQTKVNINKVKDYKEEKVNLTNKDIVQHNDPAYVYYKNGMKYFMEIHPSQWNPKRRYKKIKSIEFDQYQEQMKNKVIELAKLFPKAYYNFSIVFHEYPESNWAYDAKVKMNIIEERTKLYMKIIESFDLWNLKGRKDKTKE